MSSRSYKGFFISIQAVSHSDSQNPNPVAKICFEEGGEALTSLYCLGEFATYAEAENYCFQMAQKWIDERIASPPGEKGAVNKCR